MQTILPNFFFTFYDHLAIYMIIRHFSPFYQNVILKTNMSIVLIY